MFFSNHQKCQFTGYYLFFSNVRETKRTRFLKQSNKLAFASANQTFWLVDMDFLVSWLQLDRYYKKPLKEKTFPLFNCSSLLGTLIHYSPVYMLANSEGSYERNKMLLIFF